MCAWIVVLPGMAFHPLLRDQFITNLALLNLMLSISVILELLVAVTMPVTDLTTELSQYQLQANFVIIITNTVSAHRMQ